MSVTPAVRRPSPFATVARIVCQLKADPRTVGLILVVPVLLLTLLYFVFVDVPVAAGHTPLFNTIGPIMLAVLPMLLMFIVTSVVMLRERTSGTLERVLTTPLSRWNLIASYGAVFGFLSVAQSLILAVLVLGPMGVELAGPWWGLIIVALLDGLFGVASGLLASAFARTEFQAVQFMPVFVAPQIFLCGLFVQNEHMPALLAKVADVLPMTWAVDVVRQTLESSSLSSDSWLRIGLLAGVILLALLLASATMRRSTK